MRQIARQQLHHESTTSTLRLHSHILDSLPPHYTSPPHLRPLSSHAHKSLKLCKESFAKDLFLRTWILAHSRLLCDGTWVHGPATWMEKHMEIRDHRLEVKRWEEKRYGRGCGFFEDDQGEMIRSLDGLHYGHGYMLPRLTHNALFFVWSKALERYYNFEDPPVFQRLFTHQTPMKNCHHATSNIAQHASSCFFS